MEYVEFAHIDFDQRYSQRPRSSPNVAFGTWFRWFVGVNRWEGDAMRRPRSQAQPRYLYNITSAQINSFRRRRGTWHTLNIEVVRMTPDDPRPPQAQSLPLNLLLLVHHRRHTPPQHYLLPSEKLEPLSTKVEGRRREI